MSMSIEEIIKGIVLPFIGKAVVLMLMLELFHFIVRSIFSKKPMRNRWLLIIWGLFVATGIVWFLVVIKILTFANLSLLVVIEPALLLTLALLIALIVRENLDKVILRTAEAGILFALTLLVSNLL